METDIKVTRVGKLWVCRISIDGKPWLQNWVKDRRAIGLACQDLMRFADKLSQGNAHTYFARHRRSLDNEFDSSCPCIIKSEWL